MYVTESKEIAVVTAEFMKINRINLVLRLTNLIRVGANVEVYGGRSGRSRQDLRTVHGIVDAGLSPFPIP